ncbi:MAG: citryl-CoA lyase [Betaproteobacteria bacterium]
MNTPSATNSSATPATTAPASKAFSKGGSSHMALVETDKITVRGRDLCQEMIGQYSFTAYFLFLLTGQMPSEKLIKAADATLIAISEHGLVPSVQAARMTLAAAPDAMQGAVAAGLLGCGTVILGASETAGLLLIDIIKETKSSKVALKDVCKAQLDRLKSNKLSLPGFGHPTHKNGDPRAAKLLSLAHQWGLAGEHIQALETLAQEVPGVYGRVLPLNVSAAIPALLLDAGFPAGALRGIPLLARTGSLIAHLLEEQTKPIGFKLANAAEESILYDGPLAQV